MKLRCVASDRPCLLLFHYVAVNHSHEFMHEEVERTSFVGLQFGNVVLRKLLLILGVLWHLALVVSPVAWVVLGPPLWHGASYCGVLCCHLVQALDGDRDSVLCSVSVWYSPLANS